MSGISISDWLEPHPEIESVFVYVCDLNGTMRGKRVPVDQVQKVTEGCGRMPLSVLKVDCSYLEIV